jgi:hypothetical protein
VDLKARASFLKKRSKKLLLPGECGSIVANAPNEQKFFWFFFFKKRTADLPC